MFLTWFSREFIWFLLGLEDGFLLGIAEGFLLGLQNCILLSL